ncbi:LysR family transcriptional regulator [Lonsdalea iberica]|uniref:LysR family transcriptional regulator n=1 Tax=Lonsdalea iberica TaxID=1082703 RepID=A0ABX3XG13_9GAMM|nr:LysR family transcriptional regulator [Lonsdalea iberica]OSN10271.1 LysR family transcriptional regulator [Lonsdalea iberica]
MDLKRLKYFCKVVEEGSISQAARQLNMAQPPLSKRIHELEAELNVSLFVRTAKRIEPTEAGYYLYKKACEIFRLINDTSRETISIANKENKVLNIGLSHLFQCYFKPLFLELHRRHPDVILNISVSDSSHLEQSLNDGLIDIALIQKPYHRKGFDCLAFNPVRLVAVVNQALLPEKPEGPFPYLDVGRWPLLLLHRARDPGTYESLLDHFRKGGVDPDVIMHVTQPGVIMDLLESGLEAATLLPSSEVDGDRLQHCHIIDVFPSPQVFFPAMVKMSATPYMQELLEIIQDGYPLTPSEPPGEEIGWEGCADAVLPTSAENQTR